MDLTTTTTTTTDPHGISDEKPNAQIIQVIKSSASLDTTADSSNNHYDDEIQEQKGGTRYDGYNMNRMGKRQELRRNFRFLSIVGFIMVLQSTWESVLLAAQYGLINGGTAGLIWMTTGVIVGALCMIASLAEVASMLVVSLFFFFSSCLLLLPDAYGQNHVYLEVVDGLTLGPQRRVGSTTGYPNSHPNPCRNRSAIFSVSQKGYVTASLHCFFG